MKHTHRRQNWAALGNLPVAPYDLWGALQCNCSIFSISEWNLICWNEVLGKYLDWKINTVLQTSMSIIPLCTLPVRTQLPFEYNYGSNISRRVREIKKTGELDALKDLMGHGFSKNTENLQFLCVDQSESNSCLVFPKIIMWMERKYLMTVKRTICLIGTVYTCQRFYVLHDKNVQRYTYIIYIRKHFLNVSFVSHRITTVQMKLWKLQNWCHLMLHWRTWGNNKCSVQCWQGDT